MRRNLLAIDAGQTEVKVRFSGQDLAFPGVRADLDLLGQVAEIVMQVKRQVDCPDELAVGAAALPRATAQDAEVLLQLCWSAGVRRVWLTPDSVTSYLGAVGREYGVVVAVGTGAVTLGVGASALARVDGWGHLMGDAGSGHWIGREALDAALRALDGRGPATALSEVVDRLFPRLDEAYVHLLSHPDRVRLVASLARDVAAAAPSDPVATAILQRAGEEIAHSAATAVERIGHAHHRNPLICLIGGVVREGPVRTACVAALRAQWPGYIPFVPRGDALSGTAQLHRIPSDHPLAAHVAVAGTVLRA